MIKLIDGHSMFRLFAPLIFHHHLGRVARDIVSNRHVMRTTGAAGDVALRITKERLIARVNIDDGRQLATLFHFSQLGAEGGWRIDKDFTGSQVVLILGVSYKTVAIVLAGDPPRHFTDLVVVETGEIVAVADTFSALTSRRPWREAASVSIAVEQIEKESGFGFEPKIVGAFRDAMPELLDIRAEVPDLVPAT